MPVPHPLAFDMRAATLDDIGIVADQKTPPSGRYQVVHNMGAGPKMEDVVFRWKITGHYQYFGPGWPER